MDPSSSSSSNKRTRGPDCYDEPRYKRPKYDVFVNYASEDIGKRFVSHLKGALGREGFAIRDHTMLPLGQDESSELLKAIEDSEIYLLVFSNEYASSVRCLEEFARIMESYHKYKHRKVLPVFFNVEATDVKNQQGPFLDSFKDHETKVDPNKVQNWRQALREAGHLSGLNLKDWRDENQLIREIIKDASKMKNPQQLCDVEHPVGIESRAQDIISALRLSDPDFSMVAVLGISGSGKTTIVKAVYDRIAADFDVSCFIQDINSYVYRGPNWKVDLQRDVISCLTGNDNFISFRNNDGAAKIKKLISGQKLFLVLDDVYTFEQLQALSIPSASFHCESRIIVTSRNMQSLSNLQHTSYNIELLDTSESFELLTRLIGKGDPIDKKFVDAIVRCAGGIPLVLEVWSRHFTDYDRKLWPSMLETLKRIPHEDTQKKLRISYDSLPRRAQNLFLDIACFFHGMYKDLVVKVLQDEDFFPDFEIQNLVHKFLVKPSDNKYDRPQLLLHDVIREMGQEVVRQEDEDEPGKRTRLMGYRDVVRVLGDCSGTDSVRSIRLDINSEMKEGATVQLEAFKKMSNLRFIMLYMDKLRWSSSSSDDMSACFSFKHLKHLEWERFPCKSLDNIDMGNVVVIKLKYSKLEKLWEGVKNFKKLKILDVTWSTLLTKTGNLIGLENLEELNLSGCKNLEELDSSICCLQKLVELDLHGCGRLKRLPWEMICKLTSLQKLDLKFCYNLQEISHEIGSLISLEHLNLRNTKLHHQLTKIDLSFCTNLKSIPDLPPSIKELQANYCENLVNLPSNCSELQFLTQLWLNGCCKLGSEGFTQVVTTLRNLQKLYMRNCNVSQVSSGIGNLVSLRVLKLSYNTFSNLENCSNILEISIGCLQKLELSGCKNLEELDSSIGCLQKLVYLDLSQCTQLKRLPWGSIGKLTSLQNLNLENCSNILEISHEIGTLISLKELDLSRNRFNNLPNSLCQLHQLTHIYLNNCINLKSIPDLPLNIQYVEASYCRNLVNLPSNCSELQFLRVLELNGCCKLGSEGFTQVVTTLRNLQELGMSDCNISQVSSGIGNLVSLEYLDLSGNTFSSLPESFSNLSKLKKLDINWCFQLQLLPLLPSQLTDIEAAECGSLDVMPFDSRQKAYIFRSKVFKELLTGSEGFDIGLSKEEVPESEEEFPESEEEFPESEEALPESEEEVPEWCTYRNSGNVLSFVAPLKHFDNKICGVIFCAKDFYSTFLTVHNKTKEKSHRMKIKYHEYCNLQVVFYPLNDKTVVVEAGDTVELRFDDDVMSCGLRLVYEDDVVDSGLVLKEVRKPTLSLFPLSSESDIMTGNSITELNDEDVCSFPIQNDEEYTYYDFFHMVS